MKVTRLYCWLIFVVSISGVVGAFSDYDYRKNELSRTFNHNWDYGSEEEENKDLTTTDIISTSEEVTGWDERNSLSLSSVDDATQTVVISTTEGEASTFDPLVSLKSETTEDETTTTDFPTTISTFSEDITTIVTDRIVGEEVTGWNEEDSSTSPSVDPTSTTSEGEEDKQEFRASREISASVTESPPTISSSSEDTTQIVTEKNVGEVERFNFTVSEVASDSFTLEWENLGGDHFTYEITVKIIGPRHYIRQECTSKTASFSIRFRSNSQKDVDKMRHTIKNVEPNYEYEIEMTALGGSRNATAWEQRLTTKSSPSTEPLNVHSELIVYNSNCKPNESYNAQLVIKWERPCNTNGKLQEFRLRIEKSLYYNKTSILPVNVTTIHVNQNDDADNLFYELRINVDPSSVYDYSITPITKPAIDGTPGTNRSEKTPDGCPSRPTNIIRYQITSTSFGLQWEEPEKFYGKITQYKIEMERRTSHALAAVPKGCQQPSESKREINVTERHYQFRDATPNSEYVVRISAYTSAGRGVYSDYEYVPTKDDAPDPVRNLSVTKLNETINERKYEFWVSLTFQPPCQTNGPFSYYGLKILGRRPGYEDHKILMRFKSFNKTSKEIFLSEPERNYTFTLVAMTENYLSKAVTVNITTSAGVPLVNREQLRFWINEDAPTQIDLALNDHIFKEDNGKILYYAIILAKNEMVHAIDQSYKYGLWEEKWPEPNRTIGSWKELKGIRQITEDYWNPFDAKTKEIVYSIGKLKNCDRNSFCKSLKPDTNYVIVLRGLTNNTFCDISIPLTTGVEVSYSGAIISVVFIVILAIVCGIFVFYLRRRKMWIFKNVKDETPLEEPAKFSVAVKNFISYYNKITNDPVLLTKQYEEIEDVIKIYKESAVHTTFGLKPENKRKNRYTNILPYDEYRVKLNIDEDDEISSDYINASYIKGVSGQVEYIATQGPLEHTCKDFWKMVIQENVTVIVMVSEFVENEKEKCFRYIPNNHETLLVTDDLEVKCLTELQFDTHCTRTLLVTRETKKFSVIHIQYLGWPDFGCPIGSRDMLAFCQEVRDRIQLEKGLMIVHCSAGVGRTGTLISLDILLQTIRKKETISVYETVMELRKQRTHMVQTEKQYVYVHTCIKDALENANLYPHSDNKKEEHFYENTKHLMISERNFKGEAESIF